MIFPFPQVEDVSSLEGVYFWGPENIRVKSSRSFYEKISTWKTLFFCVNFHQLYPLKPAIQLPKK